MKPLSPQEQAVRDATVEELRAIKDSGGQVPNAVVKAAAAKCGVDPRTIRRWIAGDNEPRKAFKLSDEQLELISGYGGNVKEAHLQAQRRGLDGDVDYRTWARAWKALDPYIRAELTKGPQFAKRFQFYSERTEGFPGSRFELDGWQPNIRVRPRGRPKTAKYPFCYPTVLVIIDAASRYIMGYSVRYPDGKRGNATEDLATATMVSAMRPRRVTPRSVNAVGNFDDLDDEAFIIGGVPRVLVTDNEGALGGQAMQRLADAVGFEIDLTAPYTPEAKGKVERLFGTLERGPMFLLAGQTKGPRTYEDEHQFTEGDCTQDEFEAMLDEGIDELNHRRKHATLGMTRYEAYVKRPLALRQPDAETLRAFLMPHPHNDGERILDRRGVLVDGTYYALTDPQAIELAEVGDKVRVRIEPGEDRWVDVWHIHDDGRETYRGRAEHPDAVRPEHHEWLSRYRSMQRRDIRPRIEGARDVRAEHVRDMVGDDVRTGDLAVEAIDLIVDLTDIGKMDDPEVQAALEVLRRSKHGQATTPAAADGMDDDTDDGLAVVPSDDPDDDAAPIEEQPRPSRPRPPKTATRNRKSTSRRSRVHKSPHLDDHNVDAVIRQTAASDR